MEKTSVGVTFGESIHNFDTAVKSKFTEIDPKESDSIELQPINIHIVYTDRDDVEAAEYRQVKEEFTEIDPKESESMELQPINIHIGHTDRNDVELMEYRPVKEEFTEIELKDSETVEMQPIDYHIHHTNRNNVEPVEYRQNRISNQAVVELFYSMFKEFGEIEAKEVLEEIENTEDKNHRLHRIVCKKLRLPVGSVLRGIFNTGSFRIDVEDMVSDMIQKKCELNNITVEYVLEAKKDMKGTSLQSRADRLRKVVCETAEVDEEMIDKFTLERRVKSKEIEVKRCRQKNQMRKVQTLLKSVFYLPVKKKDFMKDLQETPDNFDFQFLQSQHTELTNGLVVDVFEELKGDRAQVRKVLCGRFTKVLSVKAKSFYEHVVKCVKTVKNLKEADATEELKKFMNSPFFESNNTVKTTPMMQIKETEKGNEKKTRDVFETEKHYPLSDSSTIDYSDSDEKEKQNLKLKAQRRQTNIMEDSNWKKKRKAYDNEFKLSVIQFAEKDGNRAAERKFGVPEKCVRAWRKSKNFLEQAPKTSKKNVSVSKDLKLIEDDLKKWFLYYRGKGSVLSKKTVMLKARTLAKEAKYNIDTARYVFGSCWCDRFMKTSGLIFCKKKTTTVRKEINLRSEAKVLSELGCKEGELDGNLSAGGHDLNDEGIDSDHEKSCDMLIEEELGLQKGVCKVGTDRHKERFESEIDQLKNLNTVFTGSEKAAVSKSDEPVLLDNVQIETYEDNVQIDTCKKKVESMAGSNGKKRKRCSYDDTFKLDVIQFAGESGIVAAAQEFSVSEILVNEWCQSKTSIENKSRNKRQCKLPAELEEELVTWIKYMQRSGSNITAQLVAYKARNLCDEEGHDIDASDFKFSHGWVSRFMKQHGLPLQRKKGYIQSKSAADNSFDDLEKELPPELRGIPNEHVAHFSDKSVDNKTKRQSYNNAFKSSVISFAESSSNNLAVKAFNISEKLVRDWRKSKNVILNGPKDRKRTVVRTGTFEELERDLTAWCRKLQKNNKAFSRNAVMLKARQLAKDGKYRVDTSQFKASHSWCTKFLNRNNYHVDDSRFREAKSKQIHTPDVATETAYHDKCINKSTPGLTKPACPPTDVIESDGKRVKGYDKKKLERSGQEIDVKVEETHRSERS